MKGFSKEIDELLNMGFDFDQALEVLGITQRIEEDEEGDNNK